MNILLVSPKFPPDGMGGVENVVKMLYSELRQDGHSVSVITRFNHTRVPDANVHQVRGGKGEFRGYSQWVVRAWNELRAGEYDLIHFNGFEGQILSLFPLLGAPCVVHLHNSVSREASWYSHERSSALRRTIGQRIVARSFLRAELIVSPTRVAKRDLILNVPGIDGDKVRVVPNPVDTWYFAPGAVKGDIRERLGLQGKFVVLYFGKIKRTKGIEDICKAFEILRRKIDAALIIGGAPTSTDWFAKYLAETYKEVFFTGRVDDPRPYYAAADAFCIYTTGFAGGEVFSLALAEAMSMGLPIVCSDNPIFREVTRDNAIFVSPKNPVALAEAILELSRSPGCRAAMGRESRKSAESVYDMRIVTRRMEEVYTELLQRLGRGPRTPSLSGPTLSLPDRIVDRSHG